MIWPLIAASAGAVGLNYQASKELDTSISRAGRWQSFWPAFALGAVTGLWLGVSFAPQITGGFAFADKWFGWTSAATPQASDEEEETSSEEEIAARKRKKKLAHK